MAAQRRAVLFYRVSDSRGGAGELSPWLLCAALRGPIALTAGVLVFRVAIFASFKFASKNRWGTLFIG
jgi:hypothetical protein